MRLLTASGQHFEYRAAPPGSPWGDTTPPTNSMGSSPVAGVTVNEKNSLGIGAVWACVGILSDAVATLPLKQYRGVGTKRREVAPSLLITDPWPEAGQNELDFRAGGTMSLALRGNTYGEIVDRDKNMTASMVRPIDPNGMDVRRNRISGAVEYRDHGKLLAPDDVFHIRNLRRDGHLVGLNPIEELRTTLGLARAQELMASAFFANSANPSGVLETSEDLSEEETLALARAWMVTHQGIGQAQMPAVLTGGVTWRQVTMNMADAQFIESRGLSRSDIAMIFRIPPHMIGDVDRTTSWGTGIEQQEMGFVRITLLGYLRRWEIAVSNLLPDGEYCRFDLKQRLRGDTLSRFQSWTLGINGGWMNPDDVLKEEGEAALPNGMGQAYRMPINFAPVGPGGIPKPMALPPGAPAPDSGPGGAPDPMGPDPGAQKSPSGGGS